MARKTDVDDGPQIAFGSDAVAAVFAAYPDPIRAKLLSLRQLIFSTAAATESIGVLQETLKWGQPSYLTAETKSGTTIRIDQVRSPGADYAIFVNCRTTLVETFRERYGGELRFGGNRSILFDVGDKVPDAALRHCLALALTYHRR